MEPTRPDADDDDAPTTARSCTMHRRPTCTPPACASIRARGWITLSLLRVTGKVPTSWADSARRAVGETERGGMGGPGGRGEAAGREVVEGRRARLEVDILWVRGWGVWSCPVVMGWKSWGMYLFLIFSRCHFVVDGVWRLVLRRMSRWSKEKLFAMCRRDLECEATGPTRPLSSPRVWPKLLPHPTPVSNFQQTTCTSSLQRPSPFGKHSQPPPPHLIFLLALGLSVSGDKGGLPEPNARPLSTLPEAALLSSPNDHHNGTDAGNSTHEANEMHKPSHIA